MQLPRLLIEPAIAINQSFPVKLFYQNTNCLWVKIVKIPQCKKWKSKFEEWQFLLQKREDVELKYNQKYSNYVFDDNSWQYLTNGFQIVEQTQKKLEKKLLRGKPVSSKVIELSKEEKKQSTEFIFEGLPLGEYAIIISTDKKFKNHYCDYFSVTNINWIVRKNHENGYEIYVFDRKNGVPLPNLKLNTYVFNCPQLFDYNFALREDLKTYTTDKNGYVQIIPEDDFRRKVYIEFKSDIDKFRPNKYLPLSKIDYEPKLDYRTISDPLYYGWPQLQAFDYDYEFPVIIDEDDELEIPNNIDKLLGEMQQENSGEYSFIFTDRLIYRPGQDIHIKGINCQTNGNGYEAQENLQRNIQLVSPKNEIISETKCTTNKFGSYSFKFNTEESAQTGKYKIKCGYITKTIHIEEYKPPTFKVKIQIPSEDFKFGDEIIVKGNAISLTGIAVEKAKVNIKVIRTPKLLLSYKQTKKQPKQLTYSTTTGVDGTFESKIILSKPKKALLENTYGFDFQVLVSVTDINGETQGAKDNIFVENESKEKINNVDAKFINILNKDLNISINEDTVATSGKINLYKLIEPDVHITRKRLWSPPSKPLYNKKEWYEKLPGFEYERETYIDTFEKDGQVEQIAFNVTESLNYNFSVKDFKAGKYVAEIISEEEKMIDKQYFILYNPDSNKPLPDEISYVQNISKPTISDQGKYIIGCVPESKVIFEILTDNKEYKKEILELKNQQNLIEANFPTGTRKLDILFTVISKNHIYTYSDETILEKENKLNIQFLSYNKELKPGAFEQWKLKISDSNGNPVESEFLATLYDASLDLLAKNEWKLELPQKEELKLSWFSENYLSSNFNEKDLDFDEFAPLMSAKEYYEKLCKRNFSKIPRFKYGILCRLQRLRITYESMDWTLVYQDLYNSNNQIWEGDIFIKLFSYTQGGLSIRWRWYWLYNLMRKLKKHEELDWTLVYPQLSGLDEDDEIDISSMDYKQTNEMLLNSEASEDIDSQLLTDAELRTFFADTVFFEPQINPDQNGETLIQFTIPEQLTKWQMKGLAHTPDMQYALVENTLVTSKPVMLVVNAPRFFREGDEIEFPVKISNTNIQTIEAKVSLFFYDALSEIEVGCIQGKNTISLTIPANSNKNHSWHLKIFGEYHALKYRVVIISNEFNDGEEKVIPILKNELFHINDSISLQIPSGETTSLEIPGLLQSKHSDTIVHENFKIEISQNPSWEIADAVASLIGYPYGCVEQKFSIYYSSMMAIHIYKTNKDIKNYIDKIVASSSKNGMHNLSNEDFPFLNKNKSHLYKNFSKIDKIEMSLTDFEKFLSTAQKSNGGIPWFKGDKEDLFITQHIIAGFGTIAKKQILTFDKNGRNDKVIKKAIKWLDKQTRKINDDSTYLNIHYLYARSFFQEKDLHNNKTINKLIDYFLENWQNLDIHCLSMFAISLVRLRKDTDFSSIIDYLLDNKILTVHGIYWPDNTVHHIWYFSHSYVETHTTLIELFEETNQDFEIINKMKQWLYNNKRNNSWGSTKSTISALNTLYSNKPKLETLNGGIAEITLNNQEYKIKSNDFKPSWQYLTEKKLISSNLGSITIHQTIAPIVTLNVNWDYFEISDKITPSLKSDVSILKQLFDENGKEVTEISKIQVGKELKVRLSITVNKFLSYVHIKDNRPAGTEPIEVFSGYKTINNYGYYEEVRDTSHNFFISSLWLNNYTIEYFIRTSHKGLFSTGIAQLQCMYDSKTTYFSNSVKLGII